jgi:hypothetical protein
MQVVSFENQINANAVQLNLFACIHICTWNHRMEFSSTTNHGKVKELRASLMLKALSLSNVALATWS